MSVRFSMKRLAVLTTIPVLLFSSCASSARDQMKRAAAETARFLEAGDIQKAVDTLIRPLRRHPGNRELGGEVAAALDEIHGIAESSLRRQNYARAESIFRVLLESYADFERAAVPLAFRRSDLENGLRKSRIGILDRDAVKALTSGDPARALDIYAAALKECPGDKDLAANHLRVAREIKAAGDKSIAAKNFAQAWKLARILLQRLPAFEGMKPGLSFGRPDLEKTIVLCRDELTKEGLAAYRRGDLAGAIAVWESLLAFDPGNAEINKAVGTARTQLKTIEKKK